MYSKKDSVYTIKSSKLVHNDILPTKDEDRIMNWHDVIWLWLGMAAQMGVFLLGASFVGKLSFYEAILAILIGNLGASIVLVLIGDIGIEYGLNYATFIRVPFGYFGSYIPMIVRAIAGICWFGIQTYFGASAIDLVINHFTGYSNIQLFFFIFAIIQIIITAKGIKGIKLAENLSVPALLILCLFVIYLFTSKLTFNGILNFPIKEKMNFWVAVTVNLSYWSTVSINITDFTRFVKIKSNSKNFFSRNFHSLIGQIIGAPIGMIIFSLVGMLGTMATGYGNPVEAILSSLPNAVLIIIGLVIIILAQLSTNIAANLFAPGNILNTIGSPKINFSKGVIISGVIGMLTFPWILIKFFLTYLPTLGAFLSPIIGIMLSDYYLIRKRKLNVIDLFQKGEYYYFYGFNPAALITYICSSIVGILYLNYSWLLCLPTSLILYYVLMKNWVIKKYKQKEISDTNDEFLSTSVGNEKDIKII